MTCPSRSLIRITSSPVSSARPIVKVNRWIVPALTDLHGIPQDGSDHFFLPVHDRVFELNNALPVRKCGSNTCAQGSCFFKQKTGQSIPFVRWRYRPSPSRIRTYCAGGADGFTSVPVPGEFCERPGFGVRFRGSLAPYPKTYAGDPRGHGNHQGDPHRRTGWDAGSSRGRSSFGRCGCGGPGTTSPAESAAGHQVRGSSAVPSKALTIHSL